MFLDDINFNFFFVCVWYVQAFLISLAGPSEIGGNAMYNMDNLIISFTDEFSVLRASAATRDLLIIIYFLKLKG